MDVITQVALGAVGGIIYSMTGYLGNKKKKKSTKMDYKRLGVATLYGALVGAVAVILTGGDMTPQLAITTGMSGSVILQKFLPVVK